jgi:branched-chain amino acid transport system permease protein
MEATSIELSTPETGLKSKILETFSRVTILGWLFGILIAVILERIVGTQLAWALGLPKIPALFGFLIMLKKPMLVPSTMLYVLLIFILPIGIVARLTLAPANRLAERLRKPERDKRLYGRVLLFTSRLYGAWCLYRFGFFRIPFC